METVMQMFQSIAKDYPNLVAQYYRDSSGTLFQKSYGELFEDILAFSISLKHRGIDKESLVGLLSENCREWIICDMALMALGAADVPRGRDITDQEIEVIYGTTQCKVIIVEKEADLKRVLAKKDALSFLKSLIVIDAQFDPKPYENESVEVLQFHSIMETGRNDLSEEAPQILERIAQGKKNDLATIIFTSGTTGMPKGVMLTQHNYVNHAESIIERISISKGEIWLTMLPVWHSFERCIQYVVYCNGLAMAYSRPIGAVMLKDFKEINPHYTTAVPRIWESVYGSINKKINTAGGISKLFFNYFTALGAAYVKMKQMVTGTVPRFKRRSRLVDFIIAIIPLILLWPGKKLGDLLVFGKIKSIFGTRFKSGISGGGSLQKKIDNFFAAAGLVLLEGYGLTESGPVISVRTEWKPEAGTIGPVFPNMEVKIINEQGLEVKPGEKGVLYTRGCQVMKGYYKNPEQTAEVLSEDGWLNSGDLAIKTYDNTFAIVGREKDTIVLLGGENIEPVPIEKTISTHPLIDSAVVVGQDQKYLGALLVPNFELLEEYAKEHNISYSDLENLLESPEANEIYRNILVESVNTKTGFRSFEQIYKFVLLKEAFQVHRELSAKQELKRHQVNELYKKEIAALF